MQVTVERVEEPFDAAAATRLLGPLLRAPDCALAYADGDRWRSVAVVIDTCSSATGAAVLEVLWGCDALDEDALRGLLGVASAAALGGPMRSLEVAAMRPCWDAWFGRAGLERVWTSYTMRRDGGLASPSAPALGEGWSWAPIGPAQSDEYHALVLAAQGGVPGTHVPPPSEMRRALTAAAFAPCGLVDGDGRLRGYVNVVCRDGVGEVRTIGRDPSLRGQGLGDVLLTKAIEVLDAQGAEVIDLEVIATNRSAIGLYARHGFEPMAEVGTWRAPTALCVDLASQTR